MKSVGLMKNSQYANYYEKNYGRAEERLLSFNELYTLHSLCNTSIKRNFGLGLGFHPLARAPICLHKTPENEWILSDYNERDNVFIYGVFENLSDACIILISKCTYESDFSKVLNEFNRGFYESFDKEDEEKFIKEYSFYDSHIYDDLCYIIKKLSGIEVLDNAETNERIAKRDYNAVTNMYSFGRLLSIFADNIADDLGIDTSDIWNRYTNSDIDEETYLRSKVAKLNLHEHKDLVLQELEKYNAWPLDKGMSYSKKMR